MNLIKSKYFGDFKKWTTAEILKDVKNIIEWLIKETL